MELRLTMGEFLKCITGSSNVDRFLVSIWFFSPSSSSFRREKRKKKKKAKKEEKKTPPPQAMPWQR